MSLVFNKPVSTINGYFSKIINNEQDFYIKTPYITVKDIVDGDVLFMLNKEVESKNYFQHIYDIEERILLNVESNSQNWFKKKIPSEILYKNQTKPWILDRNGDIVMKIPLDSNVDKLKTGDNVSLNLLLDGVGFNGKIFGSDWKCVSYELFDDNYKFFDESSDNLFTIEETNITEPEENVVEEELQTEVQEEQPLTEVQEEEPLVIEEKKKLKKHKDKKKIRKKRKKIIYANKIKYIDPIT
jgi:hypothetical protein